MKANIIILAAGEGSRLRPYTDTVPKGMVPLLDKPIIQRNLQEWQQVADCDFCIVTGYKAEIIEALDIHCIHNEQFDQTNMVWSLACALDYISAQDSENIFVSYADIVVHKSRLASIIGACGRVCVEVDTNWQALWSLRMENFFDDVETLLHDGDKITSLGKKPTSIEQVQGQYIGLMRFERKLLIDLLSNYIAWVEQAEDDTKRLQRKNIYMTDFIQNYINSDGVVKPVFIDGGWLEVDTVTDLEIYEANKDNAIFEGLLQE
jgi:choline kinase